MATETMPLTVGRRSTSAWSPDLQSCAQASEQASAAATGLWTHMSPTTTCPSPWAGPLIHWNAEGLPLALSRWTHRRHVAAARWRAILPRVSAASAASRAH